jgi:hypothetical protein
MTTCMGVGMLSTAHIAAGDRHVEVPSSQAVHEWTADVPSAGLSLQRPSELRSALGCRFTVQRSSPVPDPEAGSPASRSVHPTAPLRRGRAGPGLPKPRQSGRPSAVLIGRWSTRRVWVAERRSSGTGYRLPGPGPGPVRGPGQRCSDGGRGILPRPTTSPKRERSGLEAPTTLRPEPETAERRRRSSASARPRTAVISTEPPWRLGFACATRLEQPSERVASGEIPWENDSLPVPSRRVPFADSCVPAAALRRRRAPRPAVCSRAMQRRYPAPAPVAVPAPAAGSRARTREPPTIGSTERRTVWSLVNAERIGC